MKKKGYLKSILFYLAVMAVGIVLLYFVTGSGSDKVEYSEIVEYFRNIGTEEEAVKTFELDSNNNLTIETTNKKKISYVLQDRDRFYEPLAAVITSLSLEHTGMLGNTLVEIAAQKCGIIKPGCQVAAYCDLPQEAEAVVRDTCRGLGIEPAIAQRNQLTVQRSDATGSTFTYQGETYRIAMAGAHQVYNSLTALMAVRCLREAGLAISKKAVEEGLARAGIPGRLQFIPGAPALLLDGAHNPEKIRSLCAFLDANFPDTPVVSVMGMLDTKDDAACVPLVAARSAALVGTLPPDGRAVPVERLVELAAPHTEAYARENPAEAAKLALQLCPACGLILVCGSMYLLSEVKTELTSETDKI